ncbi:MAG: glycosyltransferase family 4 protein [Bacteroidota bacterium]
MSHRKSSTDLRRPRVLIGSLSSTTPGSIATITQSFINGLGNKYRFIVHYANRKYGGTRQSVINPVNVLYFAKHFLLWVGRNLLYRPAIAHYPLGSFWNLEKSLLFFKLARWCGASTVGHLHSGAFVNFWKSAPGWRKRLARRELSALSAVVVLSEGWKERVHCEVGIDQSRIHIVNNPIEEEFESAALNMPIGRCTHEILSIGAYSRPKGMFDAIEAFARIQDGPEWKLVLAGPEREPRGFDTAARLTETLGIADRVELLKGAWGQDKIELFRRASIFFLPSHFENFPLVAIEAAAAGIPIVSTPVGALPEFFHDGESVLFAPVGEIDVMAHALGSLTAEGGRRERLGGAARAVFQSRLTRAHIMASMDSVYQSVLHNHD